MARWHSNTFKLTQGFRSAFPLHTLYNRMLPTIRPKATYPVHPGRLLLLQFSESYFRMYRLLTVRLLGKLRSVSGAALPTFWLSRPAVRPVADCKASVLMRNKTVTSDSCFTALERTLNDVKNQTTIWNSEAGRWLLGTAWPATWF